MRRQTEESWQRGLEETPLNLGSKTRGRRGGRTGRLGVLVAAVLSAGACAGQQPGTAMAHGTAGPCQQREAGAAASETATGAALRAAGLQVLEDKGQTSIGTIPCQTLAPVIDWYARFLNGPQVKPLTPREKAWLAVRNVGDPFNLLTIGGEAAISVAANAHSPYGPGMAGFARNAGVSLTEDITGEFFGTFLIPSLAHQDPHYHRMPKATILRRALHTVTQVAWTQGDNGRGMLNYADLVGFAIDDEIGNLYVPGRQTDARATAERYGIGLATAPLDNIITEFLPDVARRIHVRVVIVQRIIDQVATTGSETGQ